jgi:hypothetical protein
VGAILGLMSPKRLAKEWKVATTYEVIDLESNILSGGDIACISGLFSRK